MRLGTGGRAGNDAAMTRRRGVLLGTMALVAGVIATYATAWMAVAFAPVGNVRVMTWDATAAGWQDDELRWPWPISGPLARPTFAFESRSRGLRVRHWVNFSNSIYVMDDAEASLAASNGLNPVVLELDGTVGLPMKPYASVDELRAGWPLTSVRWWAECGDDHGNKPSNAEHGVFRAWSTRSVLSIGSVFFQKVLPLRPIWPLFIANVLIWALAFAGVVSGFAWMVHGRRVRRRRRRGWCLACGYDLSGLPSHQACPECGTPRAGPELSPPETRPATIGQQSQHHPATPPPSPLE